MRKLGFSLILMVVLSASTALANDLADSYKLHAAGNLAGAIRFMKSAVEYSPRDYFPRLRLGYLQILAGDYAGAADSYSEAAELNPNAIEPKLGQQQAFVALAKYDEAERVGRAALKINPKNYLASSRLAWSLVQRAASVLGRGGSLHGDRGAVSGRRRHAPRAGELAPWCGEAQRRGACVPGAARDGAGLRGRNEGPGDGAVEIRAPAVDSFSDWRR